MNPPQFALKLIVCAHFILTCWACTEQFLPQVYIYMNLFVLLIGVWGIGQHESADAILMFLFLHVFSILEDIILLGIYQPIANDSYEQDHVKNSVKNRYRFSLGMCIVNLILKPFTAFLLYRIFKDRGGNYNELNIPGIGNLRGFGTPPGQYEDIDRSSPQHTGPMEPNAPAHQPIQQDPEKPPLH